MLNMLSDATIQEYIEIARITGFLSARKIAEQQSFRGGALDTRFTRLLYIVRKSVEWTRVNQPNTDQLTAMALYMYNLCAGYIQQALAILGQGGGIIINPGTGARSTINAIDIQFVIGTTGSPMDAGDTVLVLNYTFIQDGSIDVYLSGQLLPEDQTDQISYTIVYSESNATITFNQGVQDTQLYRIKGQYFVTIT